MWNSHDQPAQYIATQNNNKAQREVSHCAKQCPKTVIFSLQMLHFAQIRQIFINLTTDLKRLFPVLRSANGVVVAAISAGGPGWAGGLQPGDIIHTINGTPISGLEALRDMLSGICAPVVLHIEPFRAHTLDLAITDVLMPEVYGLEVIRTIRRENATLPILAITAYDPARLTLAKELGSNFTLKKTLWH